MIWGFGQLMTWGGWTMGTEEQPASELHVTIPVSSNLGVLGIQTLHRLSVVRGYRLSLHQLPLDGPQGRFSLHGTGMVICRLEVS